MDRAQAQVHQISQSANTIHWARPGSRATLLFIPGDHGSFYSTQRDPQPVWLLSRLWKITDRPMDLVFMDSSQPLHLGSTDLHRLDRAATAEDYQRYLDQVIAVRQGDTRMDHIHSAVCHHSQKTGLPVILMGHSNGTLDLSQYLDSSTGLVSAAVFSASHNLAGVTRDPCMPLLVLHHREDPCEWTTPQRADQLFARLQSLNSGSTQQRWVVGGEDQAGSDTALTGRHMYHRALPEAADHIDRFCWDCLA